jgi:hypothetical protein
VSITLVFSKNRGFASAGPGDAAVEGSPGRPGDVAPQHRSINVVHGGLQVLNEQGTDGWLIANAIIIVSMDDGK